MPAHDGGCWGGSSSWRRGSPTATGVVSGARHHPRVHPSPSLAWVPGAALSRPGLPPSGQGPGPQRGGLWPGARGLRMSRPRGRGVAALADLAGAGRLPGLQTWPATPPCHVAFPARQAGSGRPRAPSAEFWGGCWCREHLAGLQGTRGRRRGSGGRSGRRRAGGGWEGPSDFTLQRRRQSGREAPSLGFRPRVTSVGKYERLVCGGAARSGLRAPPWAGTRAV